MVTTQEIESLGWSHKATAKNGGSKLFEMNGFTLFNHADNFLKKESKDEITISQIVWNALDYKNNKKELFNGSILDRNELEQLMVKFNIDPQLTRDHKIDQII